MKATFRILGGAPDYRTAMGKDYPARIIAGISQRCRIEIFPGDYFHEKFRIASRHVARGRNRDHAPNGFGSGGANYDFVAGVNFVGGLCNAAVEKNKARVTELLSYGPARAEAAEFEKEI